MGLDLKHPHPNKKRADKAEKTIRTAYRNDEGLYSWVRSEGVRV
jgi:hypothetical protein